MKRRSSMNIFRTSNHGGKLKMMTRGNSRTFVRKQSFQSFGSPQFNQKRSKKDSLKNSNRSQTLQMNGKAIKRGGNSKNIKILE